MKLRKLALICCLVLIASPAFAVPTIFSGYDVGTDSLATSPNATAAAAAFDAATTTTLVDFESPLPADLSIPGGNITNVSGCAASLCGYNTTSGGSDFLLVSGGNITFNFTDPINAFGAYFTGWQIGTQTITYADNTSETLNMPAANINDGGTVFFGFYDTDNMITSITYHAVNDIVAVDDLRYGTAGSAPVPEPSTLLLMGVGLGGLALYRRRKQG